MRELAEYSGYSQRYLNRLFSQRMGMGMSICIRLRKLASASEELIHSNKTIAEIAERYHYESQHTFTRAFRRRYGVPPGVWRKKTVWLRSGKTQHSARQIRLKRMPGRPRQRPPGKHPHRRMNIRKIEVGAINDIYAY